MQKIAVKDHELSKNHFELKKLQNLVLTVWANWIRSPSFAESTLPILRRAQRSNIGAKKWASYAERFGNLQTWYGRTTSKGWEIKHEL